MSSYVERFGFFSFALGFRPLRVTPCRPLSPRVAAWHSLALPVTPCHWLAPNTTAYRCVPLRTVTYRYVPLLYRYVTIFGRWRPTHHRAHVSAASWHSAGKRSTGPGETCSASGPFVPLPGPSRQNIPSSRQIFACAVRSCASVQPRRSRRNLLASITFVSLFEPGALRISPPAVSFSPAPSGPPAFFLRVSSPLLARSGLAGWRPATQPSEFVILPSGDVSRQQR